MLFEKDKNVKWYYLNQEVILIFLHLDIFKGNWLVNWIFDKATYLLACIFSKNSNSYEYLIKSKNDFFSPDELITEVEKSGDVEAYTAYTTYVLGNGSIILDDIGDAVPYEMSRDPKTNGGQDTLYVRDRFICGVDGISFEKPASITASASNTDLATGTNWNIINDGTKAIPHKAIALCKIVSKG